MPLEGIDEVLRKKRTACRGWVSRSVKHIRSLLADDATPSASDLSLAVADFDSRLKNLDDVQSEYEAVIEDSALDEDLDEADRFRRESFKSRVEAAEKLRI